MFISDPVNFGALADRRKRLLQRLTNQMAGRPGGVGARMGAAAAGRPFKAFGDLRVGPAPMVTRPISLLPPGLARLLGGAAPRPLPGEASSGHGIPINPAIIPGASTPSTPLTDMGLVGMPDPRGHILPPGLGGGVGGGPPTHNGAAALQEGGGGLVPLSGGLFLDPMTGRIINPANTAPAGAGGNITSKGAVI